MQTHIIWCQLCYMLFYLLISFSFSSSLIYCCLLSTGTTRLRRHSLRLLRKSSGETLWDVKDTQVKHQKHTSVKNTDADLPRNYRNPRFLHQNIDIWDSSNIRTYSSASASLGLLSWTLWDTCATHVQAYHKMYFCVFYDYPLASL